MNNKKHRDTERRLRAMLDELPAAYMPKVQPPAGSPNGIRWGRYRGRYAIWYQYKSESGYRLFQTSVWLEETEAASAVLQAGREHPQADLRYLERAEIQALLDGAE